MRPLFVPLFPLLPLLLLLLLLSTPPTLAGPPFLPQHEHPNPSPIP